MIEFFDYMQNNNNINGIPLSDLSDLFLKGCKEKYIIPMVCKDKIILKDINSNELKKLDCVCNYFDCASDECFEIKKSLNVSQEKSCDSCFKCMLKKAEDGDIGLK